MSWRFTSFRQNHCPIKITKIYSGPMAVQGGAPRTISSCIVGEGPEELSVSVATSGPQKFSFNNGYCLQERQGWAKKAQTYNCLIFRGRQSSKLVERNRNAKVLRLAANEYVARDRRWRCRLTFGFAWRLTQLKNKKNGCGTLTGGGRGPTSQNLEP